MSNERYEQIRSKLSTFGNPLKRFMKSKYQSEVESEAEDVNRLQIGSRVSERNDELANPASGKYHVLRYIGEIKTLFNLKQKKKKCTSLFASIYVKRTKCTKCEKRYLGLSARASRRGCKDSRILPGPRQLFLRSRP